MVEFLLVADKFHPDKRVWVSATPQTYWLEVMGEKRMIQFLIGTCVGPDNRAEVFMSADIPVINNERPVMLLSRFSNHRESDIFAAWRAMHFLWCLPTSPTQLLEVSYVESAYAAGMRRTNRPKTPGLITAQSELIIKALRPICYERMMELTPPGIKLITPFLVRYMDMHLSPDSFSREMAAKYLSAADCHECRKIVESQFKQTALSTAGNLSLFDEGEIARLDADRWQRYEELLRGKV